MPQLAVSGVIIVAPAITSISDNLRVSLELKLLRAPDAFATALVPRDGRL